MTSIGKCDIYFSVVGLILERSFSFCYSPCRFVNLSPDIADNFKCSVCLDIFESPLELPCGHIYCLECIRSCFHSSNTIECPECRARVEYREVKPPNRKLLCLLHNLNIKCEFADRGCDDLVKVENLMAHTRDCRFNRTSSQLSRQINPPLEDLILAGDLGSILDEIFGGGYYCLERRQQLQIIFNAYAQAISEENQGHRSGVVYNEQPTNDDEFLINNGTPGSHVCRWISLLLCRIIAVTLMLLVISLLIAATVIGALKLDLCIQMPTLPKALIAFGISMFLTVILETVRNCYYEDKLCYGLKFIQLFGFGSLIYLAVVVYSNLKYNAINVTTHNNSSLTCDKLLFEFSFWLVSGTLFFIVAVIIIAVMILIFANLKTIWSEWQRSYILLSFIYSIPISGTVMSIATVTMASIYFDSCVAIPSLTTRLTVFGALGLVCWLLMLLCGDFKNCCVWIFVLVLLASFISVATAVHQHFPWQFTSHGADAIDYTINCSATIYIYAFVIVCINYAILGTSILMYTIYGGVCACLFFT